MTLQTILKIAAIAGSAFIRVPTTVVSAVSVLMLLLSALLRVELTTVAGSKLLLKPLVTTPFKTVDGLAPVPNDVVTVLPA